MSFSSEAKAELCRERPEKKCCALAESYGVLLYCHSFSAREIRIITASDDFAARLPKLFRRAFSLSFDVLPAEGAPGKKSFLILRAQSFYQHFFRGEVFPVNSRCFPPVPSFSRTYL